MKLDRASLKRIHAALTPADHKTGKAWRGIKQGIAGLTDRELAEALDLELTGRRRTEHLKLMDIEIRRRKGNPGARKFKVEASF